FFVSQVAVLARGILFAYPRTCLECAEILSVDFTILFHYLGVLLSSSGTFGAGFTGFGILSRLRPLGLQIADRLLLIGRGTGLHVDPLGPGWIGRILAIMDNAGVIRPFIELV